MSVSASDWGKGIALSVAASIVGAASKLAIRKSWLLEHQAEQETLTIVSQEEPLPDDTLQVPAVDMMCCGLDDTCTKVGLFPHHRRGHLLTEETDPLEDFEEDDYEHEEDDHQSSESGSAIVVYGPETRRVRYCPPVSWLAWGLRASGMLGMSVLNPLCCVFAMNYASPSILAPFSGLTLVWIVLLSSPLIGEQPSSRQIVAAALIVLGEVVVAVFGDHTNDEDVTVHDVVSSFAQRSTSCWSKSAVFVCMETIARLTPLRLATSFHSENHITNGSFSPTLEPQSCGSSF